jgi:hypothetical protein
MDAMVPVPRQSSVAAEGKLGSAAPLAKPQSALPEGGSSSATPRRGYGSHGTKRWYCAPRSAMALKMASCCGATRVVSEFTTVWNAGTVFSWRTTPDHETATVASGACARASGASGAAAQRSARRRRDMAARRGGEGRSGLRSSSLVDSARASIGVPRCFCYFFFFWIV